MEQPGAADPPGVRAAARSSHHGGSHGASRDQQPRSPRHQPGGLRVRLGGGQQRQRHGRAGRQQPLVEPQHQLQPAGRPLPADGRPGAAGRWLCPQAGAAAGTWHPRHRHHPVHAGARRGAADPRRPSPSSPCSPSVRSPTPCSSRADRRASRPAPPVRPDAPDDLPAGPHPLSPHAAGPPRPAALHAPTPPEGPGAPRRPAGVREARSPHGRWQSRDVRGVVRHGRLPAGVRESRPVRRREGGHRPSLQQPGEPHPAGHAAVRQFRRGPGGGPRQSQGRCPAPHPGPHPGPPDRACGRRTAGGFLHPAQGRRGAGVGRRHDSGRRRGDRRGGLGG